MRLVIGIELMYKKTIEKTGIIINCLSVIFLLYL